MQSGRFRIFFRNRSDEYRISVDPDHFDWGAGSFGQSSTSDIWTACRFRGAIIAFAPVMPTSPSAPGKRSFSIVSCPTLAPSAALFRYSHDRKGKHPRAHLAGYAGIQQADAYAGFNEPSKPERAPGPVREACCWAHARQKFFKLADINRKAKGGRPASPLALETVQRFNTLFDIERAINGQTAGERPKPRQEQAAPLVAELQAWTGAIAAGCPVTARPQWRWTTC